MNALHERLHARTTRECARAGRPGFERVLRTMADVARELERWQSEGQVFDKDPSAWRRDRRVSNGRLRNNRPSTASLACGQRTGTARVGARQPSDHDNDNRRNHRAARSIAGCYV